jgi:nucleotide-binding universal stress UspA family protein
MFRRIVVGADGSPQALRAVEVATEIARLSGGTVHVVTASSLRLGRDVERMRARLPEEFRDSWDPFAEDHAHLTAAAAQVRMAGVEVAAHDVSGNPVDGILDVAEEVDADLVVVGSRGLGTAKRLVLGSVSTRLAHHSHRNLLIVHDEA